MTTMSGQRTRLYRRPDRGVLGGVCAGIGEYLGIDAVLVRVAVALLVAAGGLGVALYALAWALIPAAPQSSTGEASGERELRRRLSRAASREALGVGLLVLAALLGLRAAGLWLGDALVWPVVLASSGLALIWRQSEASAAWEPAELRHPIAGVRARLRGEHGADGRRTLIGVVLVVLAAYSLLRSTDTLNAVGRAAGGILVLAAAVLLVLGRGSAGSRDRSRPSAPSGSARRSARRSPRTCTTRSCRRSR